jgi:predicted short-subunit dehydrogenase-like oxidoreductase (DUF2520 family)
MEKAIRDIVIIGAGNVGTHLGRALSRAGFRICQVAGWREQAVKALASELDTGHTTEMQAVRKRCDLYIMALPDNIIEGILPVLGLTDELLVHTSGSLPLNILSPFSSNTGVLYPLQTFSRKRDMDLQEVPFLIEACNPESEDLLLGLAGKLSHRVGLADSGQRQALHIAAVFACNFTNRMYDIARRILEEYGLDFSLLVPLIRETAKKATEIGPAGSQTGPAYRRDMKIIEKHLDILARHPGILEIYRDITNNILDES